MFPPKCTYPLEFTALFSSYYSPNQSLINSVIQVTEWALDYLSAYVRIYTIIHITPSLAYAKRTIATLLHRLNLTVRPTEQPKV